MNTLDDNPAALAHATQALMKRRAFKRAVESSEPCGRCGARFLTGASIFCYDCSRGLGAAIERGDQGSPVEAITFAPHHPDDASPSLAEAQMEDAKDEAFAWGWLVGALSGGLIVAIVLPVTLYLVGAFK